MPVVVLRRLPNVVLNGRELVPVLLASRDEVPRARQEVTRTRGPQACEQQPSLRPLL